MSVDTNDLLFLHTFNFESLLYHSFLFLDAFLKKHLVNTVTRAKCSFWVCVLEQTLTKLQVRSYMLWSGIDLNFFSFFLWEKECHKVSFRFGYLNIDFQDQNRSCHAVWLLSVTLKITLDWRAQKESNQLQEKLSINKEKM